MQQTTNICDCSELFTEINNTHQIIKDGEYKEIFNELKFIKEVFGWENLNY